jgi:hypothetical protein
MNTSFEFAGFFIGVIGAIWLKVSMDLLRREESKQEMKRVPAVEDHPAVTAFIKGLSLILVGFGMETFARLFLH